MRYQDLKKVNRKRIVCMGGAKREKIKPSEKTVERLNEQPSLKTKNKIAMEHQIIIYFFHEDQK